MLPLLELRFKLALSPEEAAALLGISKITLMEYIHRLKDPIPYFRIGETQKNYKIPTAALEKWVLREAGVKDEKLS